MNEAHWLRHPLLDRKARLYALGAQIEQLEPQNVVECARKGVRGNRRFHRGGHTTVPPAHGHLRPAFRRAAGDRRARPAAGEDLRGARGDARHARARACASSPATRSSSSRRSSVRAVEEDWRGQLADYVLGQQAGPEAAATKGHLRRSEAARSWTRSLLDSLAGLYPERLDAGRAGRRARPAQRRSLATATRRRRRAGGAHGRRGQAAPAACRRGCARRARPRGDPRVAGRRPHRGRRRARARCRTGGIRRRRRPERRAAGNRRARRNRDRRRAERQASAPRAGRAARARAASARPTRYGSTTARATPRRSAARSRTSRATTRRSATCPPTSSSTASSTSRASRSTSSAGTRVTPSCAGGCRSCARRSPRATSRAPCSASRCWPRRAASAGLSPPPWFLCRLLHASVRIAGSCDDELWLSVPNSPVIAPVCWSCWRLKLASRAT